MTSGSQYDQQPGTPYATDVLNPHDTGLVGALEWGAAGVGTFFDWGAQGQTNYTARVNARRGQLEVELGAGPGDPADLAPRGQSFLVAPLSKWTPLPASASYDEGIIVYVRQCLSTTTLFQNGPATPNTGAGIMLATFAQQITGNVAVADQNTAFARLTVPPWIPGPPPPQSIPVVPQYAQGLWNNGVINIETGSAAGHAQMYWRFAIFHENADESEVIAQLSRDGRCWVNVGGSEIQDPGPGLHPEGLYVGCYATGEYVISAIDFVRAYSIPNADTFDPGNADTMVWPDSGGRIYVP